MVEWQLRAARVVETGMSLENGVLEHWSDGITGSIYLTTRQYSITPARHASKVHALHQQLIICKT
jgi:hypothetical protein